MAEKRAPQAEGSRPIEQLSPRKRELLELLARGLTNDEIASALQISAGTVRTHVTSLLAQLEVTNRTEAAALFVAWEAGPARVAAVMKRPAIAVLPLVPHGDDAHVRALAGGLTDDLASLFARWCWFPVIATASSASARGLGASSREIGAQLGARFLVDGSVRAVGSVYRLSLQIADAESDHLAWNEQRDFPASSLFEVQDDVCRQVVAAAYPVLVARVQAGLPKARAAADLSSWELAHDGMALRGSREPEANREAMKRFREALAREPGLVLAHYGLGLAAYDAVLNQWGPKEQALETLAAAAEGCLSTAPHGAEGHYLLGRYHQTRGQWARASSPLEAAVGHNPSFALAHAGLSQSLQVSGKSDEALVRMQHAVRLGPRSFVAGLATLHFMRGEYAEALEAAERVLVTAPRYSFAQGLAAASCWFLGELPRGKAHLDALRERHPAFRPRSFAATFGEGVEAVDCFARGLEALSKGR